MESEATFQKGLQEIENDVVVIASSSDQQNRLRLADTLPSPDTCCVYYTLQRRYRQQSLAVEHFTDRLKNG